MVHESLYTMSSPVLVLAPHLFAKKRSSRYHLRRSYLHKAFMPTDSNNTDPQLPDAMHALRDERLGDRAALGEGRITKDGSGDHAARRASGKKDSSDSSLAGQCCHIQPYNYGVLSYAFCSVSYFRPVETLLEKEALKKQLKEVEEHHLSNLKDAEEQANKREVEERADQCICEVEERAGWRVEDVKGRIREAQEQADRRVREAEEQADHRVGEAVGEAGERAERCVGEAERRVGEADQRVKEAGERADRHVREAEERANQCVGKADQRVREMELRAEQVLNNVLGKFYIRFSSP
jgi:vacuolar-type H+-ATPase subunit H